MHVLSTLSLAALLTLPALAQTKCEGIVTENLTAGVISLSNATPASCQAITKFNLTKEAQQQYDQRAMAKGDKITLTLAKEGTAEVSGIALREGTCEGVATNGNLVQFTKPCKGEEKLDFTPVQGQFIDKAIEMKDTVRVTITLPETKRADEKVLPTVTSLALIRSEFRIDAVIHAVVPQTGTILLTGLVREGVIDPSKDRKLTFVEKDSPTQFLVADSAARERLNDFAKGDRVRVRVTYHAGEPPRLDLDRIRAITMEDKQVPWWSRLGLLLVPPLVLAVVAAGITKRHAVYLFFVGADNQTSNSKTQASLWFFLILTAFCAVFGARLIYGDYLFGSVGMPANLGILAGISGLTFVGAKAIRTSQEENTDETKKKLVALKGELKDLETKATAGDAGAKIEADKKGVEIKSIEAKLTPQADETNKKLDTLKAELKDLEAKAATGDTAAKAALDPKRAEIKKIELPGSVETARRAVSELTTDNQGGLSLGDSQMIFITLVAVIAYLLQLWHYLGTMELRAGISLPDIDGSLTALFGISQGTYLANKSASKPVK